MKMSKCKIAIFVFLHFLMIMVHYRHENEADGQAAVPAEIQAPLGDIVAPGAASPADLLAPHGQFWTSLPDGELVIVDPTAEVQWGPAPRINWGDAHAEPVTCRPLDFFFTLLPMGFLREVLVPATNANLQEMTAAVLEAGHNLLQPLLRPLPQHHTAVLVETSKARPPHQNRRGTEANDRRG